MIVEDKLYFHVDSLKEEKKDYIGMYVTKAEREEIMKAVKAAMEDVYKTPKY